MFIAFAQGDLKAFEEIYLRYAQRIYNLFLRRTQSKETADDLTQETFFRLIKARDRYTPQQKFAGYLFTISFNLLRDHEKKMQRWAKVLHSESSETPGREQDSGELHALEALELNEMIAALRKSLQELPAEQAKVLELTRFQGYSYAETAAMLGISEAAARQKAYRALKTLRTKLEKFSGENS